MSTRRPTGTSSGDRGPMREPPPSPEAVFRAMNVASRKMPQYFDRVFGVPDLRLTEFAVLQQLSESGPTPMVRLSDENLVTKAAVTAIIDVMEAKGLVRRVRNSPDRRVVNIQMTPAGKKLFVVARRRYQEIVAGFVSTLEPDELRALVRSFEKLIRFVDASQV
jgi:MarR family transcriptional regulator, 2-MHQ and catechol-resistance regulon repressor